MTNGSWTAVGLQTGLPAGNTQTLGPFAFQFSAVQSISSDALFTGQNGFSIFPGASGLWIFPPPGNAVTLLLQGDPSDVGTFINPLGPTYIGFDPVNYPTTMYLTVSGNVVVTFQYV